MSNRQSIEDRKQELAFKAELEEKVKARQVKLEEEFVENVLIKEAKGGGDRVFIVNRLPKALLYVAGREMVPTGERQVKTPTGSVNEELLPGIELSQTGDGGFVFFPGQQESSQKLAAIDRYIAAHWPSNRPLPKREYYCYQPGNPMSPPRPLSQVSRVEIPSSPPAEKSAATGLPSLSDKQLDAIKAAVKAQLVEEAKAKNKERMAKVREAKKKKD